MRCTANVRYTSARPSGGQARPQTVQTAWKSMVTIDESLSTSHPRNVASGLEADTAKMKQLRMCSSILCGLF